MLKTRLIPCLLLKNGLLVRSEEFSLHQIVGNPIHQVEHTFVMRDEHGSDLPLMHFVVQQFHHRPASLAIQAGGRFVGQDE